MPLDHPATRFFGTTELLAEVLLNIGTLKDLMILRGVCQKWRDVIEDTPSLQRLIFLAPQPSEDHEWHGDDRRHRFWTDRVKVKSILLNLPKGHDNSSTRSEVLSSARINPLLFYTKPEHVAIPIWRPRKYSERFGAAQHWTSQELYLRMEAKPPGIRANSPLLRMFATQPPLPVMSLRTYDSDHRNSVRDIRNPKGVKVADILRAASQLGGRKAVVVDEVIFPEGTDRRMMMIRSHKDDFPSCSVPW